ncbi:hypothetical protein [Roseateles amylovorans]|jgi:hypothetical protein|uniref:DUF4124 domain-containing protein n=1 Tax=Roseateles amylovorans TaxID=2978473 RepID=A0ABY6AZ20_9BURK|nr:hypothetical protein [Roseateles amylovorans]UXH78207.1 hypothetical protein N4261_25205 [Roseateles amylovorans]
MPAFTSRRRLLSDMTPSDRSTGLVATTLGTAHRLGGAHGRSSVCVSVARFSRAVGRALTLGVLTAAVSGAFVSAVAAQGQPSGPSSIYSCTTADGRKLTSDRPIPECAAREQRVLNSDGSVRKMMPPTLSPEEQAVADARQRAAEVQRLALQDAVRRDRNLLQRYRDEPAHQRAREAALDDIRQAMQLSEKRLKDLAAERKPMQEEAEFYKGKRLPLKLQHQMDMNDAAAEAQRQSIENQRAELVRVNRLFDEELSRLKRMWAGGAPGSLEKATLPLPASR